MFFYFENVLDDMTSAFAEKLGRVKKGAAVLCIHVEGRRGELNVNLNSEAVCCVGKFPSFSSVNADEMRFDCMIS
jgi:hypothetical protein